MPYKQTVIKNKYLKSVMLFGMALLVFTTNCWGQVLDAVQKNFGSYTQNNLQEKVYVHTDKSFYLAGEILWFKIYNVDGDTHKPLNLSKVAYAEVLDKNNNSVLQVKVALKDGSGSGSFYLPVSVNTGNYKVCVYTSWMKNFSPDYYFQQVISIVNPLKSPEAASKPQVAAYDIQFFPEGGNMLNNVSNKVAFRVVNNQGQGVNFSGAIINEHNDTAAIIKPLKFGIGSFVFKPIAGHVYQAAIRINNKIIKQDMPAAITQGYAMRLTEPAAGQLHISVSGNTKDGETVYLFAHTRQQVKVALSAALSNGSAEFVVDKNKLGDGISHITIFNSARQPVCERLFFKRPQQILAVSTTSDRGSYQTRKKVELEVSAKDKDGKPVAADMSLSVYRLDSLQTAGNAGIQSYLWLTSDLKGNIENPDYYFNNKTAEADEALDNLMLTQGWRRFNWANVLKDQLPAFKYIPEYTGHLIKARITDPQSGQPAKGIIACLSAPGKRMQFYTSSSDSLGYLTFNTKSFYGANELIVQTVNDADSLYRIEVLNPFADHFAAPAIPELHLHKDSRNLLEQYNINVQAQNIYMGDKIRLFYNPLVDSAAFYGNPKRVYMLDDYVRFTTMEEVLREYVHEVIVGRSQKKFRLRVLNEQVLLQDNPLVFLDGIPIFDMDKVIALDPLKIKKLEVVNERYYMRPLIKDGVLNFSSYKTDLAGYEIDPHALVLDYEGMQLKRDFFSPVYETPEQLTNHLPDNRSLLYWQPNVTTDAGGKTKISFYTSDQTGTYTGVIQGITNNAQAGGGTFTFEVKK